MFLVDSGHRMPRQATDDPRSVRALSDAELMELGFQAIYQRYAPYVARVAFQVMGSRQDVEDIVQDVFLEAHRSLHKLREPAALKGWLATVTVRRVRRVLRKKRLKLVFTWGTDEHDLVETMPDTGIGAEDWAMLQNILDVLDKKASIDDRIAWSLRHVSGHTIVDIAELCDCSQRTIHRRITRAEQIIEKELGRE